MLLVRAIVSPSPIHGMGLFAADAIAAGAVWWRFDPLIDRTIPERVLPQYPEQFRLHVETYGFLTGGFWTLCGDLAIFVNHSDNPPSLHADNVSVAGRDIAAGEEITERYSDFHSPWRL